MSERRFNAPMIDREQAMKERDYERRRVDRAEAELARLRPVVEAARVVLADSIQTMTPAMAALRSALAALER